MNGNPFDLHDQTIRDLDHVLVTRPAPAGGLLCTFRKRFKAVGLSEADYWLTRENDFLLDFKPRRRVGWGAQGGALDSRRPCRALTHHGRRTVG